VAELVTDVEVAGCPSIPNGAARKPPNQLARQGFTTRFGGHDQYIACLHRKSRKHEGREHHGELSILQPVPVDETDRPRCVAPGVRSPLSAAAPRTANVGCLYPGSPPVLGVVARRPLVVRVFGVGLAEPS
jgi:hypothetical protein